MYKKIILLLFISTGSLFSFVDIDTVSIKGNINFDQTNLTGNFIYTLKNNTDKALKEWELIIHPSVNILSIVHENNQIKVDLKNAPHYHILKISFAKPILPYARSSINISFSINQQNINPRFTINENLVFLDARQFWFPYPTEDNNVNFNINITTPKNLTAIMGGKKNNEAVIIDKKIVNWQNELQDLIPSATLIITNINNFNKDNLYIYQNDQTTFDHLYQLFFPFWQYLQQKYKKFPITEIHIIPISNLTLPASHPYQIEAEFLGNIFLVEESIINNVSVHFSNTNSILWSESSEKLIEVLLHELYHSIAPGLIKHNKTNYIFMESLVQFFTWDTIKEYNPEWHQRITQRTRYYIQNFFLTKQFNHLWDFLINTASLFGIAEKNNLGGVQLADMLTEKYRFIEYTPQDVFCTIQQYQTNENNIGFDDYFFQNMNSILSNKTLFNSYVTSQKTNFSIKITNKTFFKKEKITDFNITASTISIKHNYPFPWKGTMTWIQKDQTNSIELTIPPNKEWETNFLENIEYIKVSSIFDLLEESLSDNIIDYNDIGFIFIQQLQNTNMNKIDKKDMILSKNMRADLSTIFSNNQKLLWDSTVSINNKRFINAFIVDQENKKKEFITFVVDVNNNTYEFYKKK